jgi:hypothetical protein
MAGLITEPEFDAMISLMTIAAVKAFVHMDDIIWF